MSHMPDPNPPTPPTPPPPSEPDDEGDEIPEGETEDEPSPEAEPARG